MQNMEEHLNAEYGRDSDGELIVWPHPQLIWLHNVGKSQETKLSICLWTHDRLHGYIPILQRTLTDGHGSSDSDVPPELFCAACNKLFKSDKA